MSDLKGKVAFVTGGSRAIGAAILKDLARNGAEVVFTYVSGGSAIIADALVKQLVESGVRAMAIQADSGTRGEIPAAIKKTVDSFGRLDIFVNNGALWITGKLEDAGYMEDFTVNSWMSKFVLCPQL